jgi:hypothetical protein
MRDPADAIMGGLWGVFCCWVARQGYQRCWMVPATESYCFVLSVDNDLLGALTTGTWNAPAAAGFGTHPRNTYGALV